MVRIEPTLANMQGTVAEFDRDTNTVSFGPEAHEAINGKNVMVLDSSVHSGTTMLKVVEKVVEMRAKAVCSYTLVLKQNSTFIPSMWAVTIGDHDRAYFLLDRLPNNHFHDSPYFHIRKLNQSDVGRPAMVCGLASLDRIEWADRYYESKNHPERTTYILESGNDIAGYVTVDHSGTVLSIEAVAVKFDSKGRGYGPALMRWAETIARHSGCRRICMWAIANRVDWYKGFHYDVIPGQGMDLGDEQYVQMEKRVLSHLP